MSVHKDVLDKQIGTAAMLWDKDSGYLHSSTELTSDSIKGFLLNIFQFSRNIAELSKNISVYSLYHIHVLYFINFLVKYRFSMSDYESKGMCYIFNGPYTAINAYLNVL